MNKKIPLADYTVMQKSVRFLDCDIALCIYNHNLQFSKIILFKDSIIHSELRGKKTIFQNKKFIVKTNNFKLINNKFTF